MTNQPSSFPINRVALIGVGLIGGSLMQALKREQAVSSVIGVGRDKENLLLAKKLGTIDEFTHDAQEAVVQADLVVLATPVMTINSVLALIKPALNKQAIVTDVGSVKALVVEQAKKQLGRQFSQFVPGHPIAGSENSGVKAAFADLYAGHRVILTPTADTDRDALKVVSDMWALTGAQVEEMSVEQHDKILAVTSHLPHVLAYALMQFLHERPDQQEYFRLAAGGLYDFTRIASSDPIMWRDICLGNKVQVSQQLRLFSDELREFADHIENDNAQGLEESFTLAKNARATVAGFRKYQETK